MWCRARIALAAALLTFPPVFAAAVPSAIATASGTVIPVTGPGFDTCSAPPDATMNTWWTNSPYYSVGIYIGGANRSCPQPNLTTNWPTYNSYSSGNGWGIINFWVGPQAPCTAFGSRFSTDTSTAFGQGKYQADLAISAALNLGFPIYDTLIYYDLEGFTNPDSTCLEAARAFINGWDYQLSYVKGYASGVYGSSCGSNMSGYATITYKPGQVHLAAYGTNKTAYSVPCVSNTYWSQNQRVHQWAKNASETWGGVQLTINKSCSDSLMNRRATLYVSCDV